MLVRIHQASVISHSVKGDGAHHQLVQAFVHIFLKIQVIIVCHRHVSHNRVVGAAVAAQGVDQVQHQHKKGHQDYDGEKNQFIFDGILHFSRLHMRFSFIYSFYQLFPKR